MTNAYENYDSARRFMYVRILYYTLKQEIN